METIRLNVGDDCWKTVVEIDGLPAHVGYLALIMDPATNESSLCLEVEDRLIYLRAQVQVTITEVLHDGELDPVLHQRQRVRNFVKDHFEALVPLAESVHRDRANFALYRLERDRQEAPARG